MNSIKTDQLNDLSLPLLGSKAACGFPSPADDHLEGDLDLNQYLIKHPAATFFVRASGDSMCEAGILSGDLLIVDRSLTPQNNSIIIAAINGEFTVKRLQLKGKQIYLYPANRRYQPIEISNLENFQIWGVVTYAIHDLRASWLQQFLCLMRKSI